MEGDGGIGRIGRVGGRRKAWRGGEIETREEDDGRSVIEGKGKGFDEGSSCQLC